ncbi:mitochondrial NAD+-dependent aldehyde dehydrogenase [Andalucia godoyi]|uniref:Aldehyde dehydrogenase n=1 Tax=Andalucia godoyi TaxID=505711 RepID=A0A8K0AHP8_ANDGO|nr:mitochondrial NAD+-dependent aldehyde dehydrogenase [Andalucia godoyi]|eukprot:ANDGO_02334.mRNA.1 mitochondrial NAD+-dependent aldehyde dehydrogenase
MSSLISATVAKLRSTFRSRKTRPAAWRIAQLKAMKKLLKEREPEVLAALKSDLNRPYGEAILAECSLVTSEIDHAISNLSSWMKPKSVSTPMVHLPGSSKIMYEPKGVVLCISPWNYPIQLCLAPLVSILAAGNCVLVKPSELAPASSAFIAKYLPEYLDNDAVAVIEGGIDVATELLQEQYDHIIYTGNGTVAKIIMAAAARHLTPTTLELGGKSPCIVAADASLDVAAKRIVFGKFLNAGQTCIAPDYLFVHESIKDKFGELLKKYIVQFFGEDPKQSEFSRIINTRHTERLQRAIQSGGNILHGGQVSVEDKYVAPTLIDQVNVDSELMRDEIFGPVLPILPFSNLDEVIDFVLDRPKPLALYVFSGSSTTQDYIVGNTSSGGVCQNDCLMHITNPELPFGGVGPSGMGAYHGHEGFIEFSHRKSVMNRFTIVDPSFKYPPLSESRVNWLRKLL